MKVKRIHVMMGRRNVAFESLCGIGRISRENIPVLRTSNVSRETQILLHFALHIANEIAVRPRDRTDRTQAPAGLGVSGLMDRTDRPDVSTVSSEIDLCRL